MLTLLACHRPLNLPIALLRLCGTDAAVGQIGTVLLDRLQRHAALGDRLKALFAADSWWKRQVQQRQHVHRHLSTSISNSCVCCRALLVSLRHAAQHLFGACLNAGLGKIAHYPNDPHLEELRAFEHVDPTETSPAQARVCSRSIAHSID